MTERRPFLRAAVPALALLAAAAAVSAVLAAVPLAGTAVLPGGAVVRGWCARSVRVLFPALAIASLAASAAAARFAGRRLAPSRLAALRHAAWLPALLVWMHASALFGRVLAGLVLPLGGTLLAAAVLRDAVFSGKEGGAAPARGRRPTLRAWLFFAATAVFLFLFREGVVVRSGFDGGGDAKHYRVQAENLVRTGSLDLTDRADELFRQAREAGLAVSRENFLVRSHLKQNDRGRVYSYHSFGLPLLVWPAWLLFGAAGDALLRILVGALALAGLRAACLAHGASRRAADSVAALTGLSCVWAWTALSFLPEMLGFGLCAWAFWAVAAQRDAGRRAAATLVAAVACAYLPVAHVRFAATAAPLALFFGIEGLLVPDEPFWRRKVPRLAVFSLVCFAGWLALRAVHGVFFSGTASYAYASIAGRDPSVMWAMFADRRGVASVAPVAFPCVAAAVAAAARGGGTGRRAGEALVAAAFVLYCCCSTEAALVGATFNGRYFYPVLPVLLPFLALALDRADRAGRLWILFLLLLPVFYFFVVSPFLPPAALIRSPAPVRSFAAFQTFWEPFASFRETGNAATRRAGSLFAAALFALSFLACFRARPRLRAAAAAALLVLAFGAGRFVDRGDPPFRAGPFAVLGGDRRFRDFELLSGSVDGFFEAFRSGLSGRPAMRLADGPAVDPALYDRSQAPADVPQNDWAGRDLRWAKVRFRVVGTDGRPGVVACHAKGRVLRGTALLSPTVPDAAPFGETRLPEGPFEVVFRIPVERGNGGVNLLLALDGNEGEAIVDEFDVVPCPPGIHAALGPFPATARVFDSEKSATTRAGGRP